MICSKEQILIILFVAATNYYCLAGVVDNVELDPACGYNATLYELRLTDCTHFPCRIRRGKTYELTALFSVSKALVNPVVKCGTIYLGREISLPGYGSCDTLTNGSCPLSPNVVYETRSTFNIRYYVPPMLYNVKCRLEDDDGEPLLCGSGSGQVV